MTKRISKSEQKREKKKKKIKNQNKLKQATSQVVPPKGLSKQIKISLPILFISLILLSLFKLPVTAEQPTETTYANASLKEINQARQQQVDLLLADSADYKAKQAQTQKTDQLKQQILAITKNTPMEIMANSIAQKSRATAAYIVGIAMKESKFGIYSPKKNGEDCFNYWGYRGKENTTASGYSCFGSPEQAINVVGGRIDKMLKLGSRSPADMVSWKCGSTCAGFDQADVEGWIHDVGINYYKLNPDQEVAYEN